MAVCWLTLTTRERWPSHWVTIDWQNAWSRRGSTSASVTYLRRQQRPSPKFSRKK